MQNLMSTLGWMRVHYYEGPDRTSPFGPFIRSERLKWHRRHVGELVEKEKAYHCFCCPERLEAVRQRLLFKKKMPINTGQSAFPK